MIRYRYFELAKVIYITRFPVYLIAILKAHFFQMHNIFEVHGFHLTCSGDEHFDLAGLWMLMELTFFYSYILSGVVFIFTSQNFKLNKLYKS